MRVRLAFSVAAVLTSVSLLAYQFAGPYWHTATVSYWVNPVNADVTEAQFLAEVQAAAAVWAAIPGVPKLTYAGRFSGQGVLGNSRPEVWVVPGLHQPETNWSAQGLYWYAGADTITDGDVTVFDGRYRFYASSEACSGSNVYLKETLVHEFGHVLGLGHSSIAAATMYPNMPTWCGHEWATLDADDVAAIRALYRLPLGVPCPSGVAVRALGVPCPSNVQVRVV